MRKTINGGIILIGLQSKMANTWFTDLLAYQFNNWHLTILFTLNTPENIQLNNKVYSYLYNRLPKKIEVEFLNKTFSSPYNDSIGKIAQEVKIITDISKLVPIIERFSRATFRPHISVRKNYPSSQIYDRIEMNLSRKQGTMHKSKFTGFPEYKFRYIVNGPEADLNSK